MTARRGAGSPGGCDVRGKWVSQPKREVTESHADVIAVLNAWANYKQDPPANDEGRPAIMDMDHISPSGSDDRILPWKAFTRGYHYSIYDHPFENRRDEGPSWELARRNTGTGGSYSRRFSDQGRGRGLGGRLSLSASPSGGPANRKPRGHQNSRRYRRGDRN